MRRAVFLDRDGVLNAIVPRDGRPGSPRRFDELVVVEGAGRAVERLRAAGWLAFIVTNQPDIARGLMPQAELDAIMAAIRDEIEVDDAVVCPHDDADGCACRKPRPGMLLSLAERWGVDPARSYMIGDTERDMGAARAAGCRGILLRRGYNADARADARVETLDEAVTLILDGGMDEQ